MGCTQSSEKYVDRYFTHPSFPNKKFTYIEMLMAKKNVLYQSRFDWHTNE